MYLGKLVELADSFELIAHSVHPYTRSLISAIPRRIPRRRAPQAHSARGRCPEPAESSERLPLPHPLPYADEQCANECPQLKEVSPGHFAACHHLDKVAD